MRGGVSKKKNYYWQKELSCRRFYCFFISLAINAIVSLEINRGNAAYADKVSAIKINEICFNISLVFTLNAETVSVMTFNVENLLIIRMTPRELMKLT